MSKTRQLVIAIAVGAAIAVSLLAVVGLSNAGFAGATVCTGSAAFGWLSPLFMVVVAVGLGYLLTRQTGSEDPFADGEHVSCPGCFELVRKDWRICPFCGAPMADSPRDGSTPGGSEGEGAGGAPTAGDRGRGAQSV